MRAHRALTQAAFAAELAPVLGNEQALAMVQAAAGELGYRSEMVVADQQRAILAWLGAKAGVIGAAARHLLRQFDARAPVAVVVHSSQAQPGVAVSERAASCMTRAELTAVFERALSTEKAREIVDKACRARDLNGDPISVDAAMSILEELAKTPGIVGVVARFAKARLALRLTNKV